MLFGGLLDGSGTINGKTVSGGAVAPGDPQTLTINGDYEQQSTGTLVITLAGSDPAEQDHLVITGNLQLDSGAKLDLDFIDGFAPAIGQTFDVLRSGDLTSTDSFSEIDVQGLEPGWEYAIEQQNGNVVVESLSNGVAVPEPSAAVELGILLLNMAILHRLCKSGRRIAGF